MNAHQRRVAERAKRPRAVWTPTGLAIGVTQAEIDAGPHGGIGNVPADYDPLRNLKVPKDLPQVVGRATRKTQQSGETTFSHPMKPETLAALNADAAAHGHLEGFFFSEGGSVRNKRTKSIATMLYMVNEDGHPDSTMIRVKRGDNRKVEWPLSECENWNL